MSSLIYQGIFFFFVLLAAALPLGWYIKEVMQGRIPRYARFLQPLERLFYKVIGPVSKKEMRGKTYFVHVLLLSFSSLVVLLLLLMTQQWLPGGEKVVNLPFDLALNTAVSFVTNTNWQAYAGETTLSHFSQIFGLTVQNFVSAGIGLSVACALIRGISQKQKRMIGNFWQDLTRSLVYILLPLAFILAIVLISQGSVQTFSNGTAYQGLEGKSLWLYLGPVASQVAIKQLGTNGGGFFGANAAHPFENPTILANFFENLAILLIPAALIFAFGFWVKDWKQGRTILIASLFFVSLAFVGVVVNEYYGPQLANVVGAMNMEGKEVRFGIGWSSLWAISTTAASNGSVNAMLDSFTPLGGAIPLFLMQLGEIIFGGVGSGLYGMMAFLLLAVFIAGLLVGRTPEYLGKKIEAFDIKMASVVILTPLLLTLFGAMALVLHPDVMSWLTNSGPHAFSELLYGATSLANNNGSAFAGLAADTPFINLLGSLLMTLSRYLPMLVILLLAENMGSKKKSALSEGTLSTSSPTFVTMLIIVIFVVGALSFLPAMALGPIAEYFRI
ncbi:potassium-transporting ATPase subunit KdpA [Enterococcus pallens]|uniref:Potassium-transporting ATPase potassium-binding subunit n=1 Tax=Enterococcus pallens ATCC BAA-351 TaxID=1158607 RepID=R2QEW8_9ENTE|nr:potassium-transporting ATPase subunit KdpA [Enterococcus pallens]EOH93783.1 K+-transporting ATPase, A subunit [Enterococcus pallens ATCC BAA-351]EOU24623.1 K+-transporting ATPase, A subunit [Enterococcus pallens ATCC BAA-351]OJG79555.1 K+-transporting ATPase, A subunit [Enterococcus pallens]